MPNAISDRFGALQFDAGTDGRQKFKRMVYGAMALLAVLVLLPNTFTYINPGYVGIVIHRAGGGVDPTPLGPGVHPRIPFDGTNNGAGCLRRVRLDCVEALKAGRLGRRWQQKH